MVTSGLFWATIAECRQAAQNDLHRFNELWEKAVEAQDQHTAQLLMAGILEATAGLATWKHFTAAWILSGGSRSDFMLRYCEWVISHGEEFYHAVRKNPDQIPYQRLLKGRWYEAKLFRFALNATKKRHGLAWAITPDQALWNPIVESLSTASEKAQTNAATTELLKNRCPFTPSDWSNELPHLNAYVEKNKVPPAQDRRLPMTLEKFWLLIDEAKNCHDATTFLTYSLQGLPTAQIVGFDSILDRLLENARPQIHHLIENDPGLEGLPVEEVGSLLVVMGKEVYEAVSKDPSLWQCVNEGYETWKGQHLRKAAKQAFLEKTGHADPCAA